MPLKEWLTKKHERRKRLERPKSEESILTDDPLSTLAYPAKKGPSKHVDQIYAVCRVNPIFSENEDGIGILDAKDDISQISSNSDRPHNSTSSGFSEDSVDQTSNPELNEDGIGSVDSQKGTSISTPSGSPTSLALEIDNSEAKEQEDDIYEEIRLGHDHQCLEISKLALENDKHEPAQNLTTLVDQLVQKRQNLRRASPKTIPPVLTNNATSGVANSSDESKSDSSVRSVASPQWQHSVASIRKMWNFENQKMIQALPEVEDDSLGYIDESCFETKSMIENEAAPDIEDEESSKEPEEINQSGVNTSGSDGSLEANHAFSNATDTHDDSKNTITDIPKTPLASGSTESTVASTEELVYVSRDDKIYIGGDKLTTPFALNIIKEALSESNNCSNSQSSAVPNIKLEIPTNSSAENDNFPPLDEPSMRDNSTPPFRQNATFVNKDHSKFLNDEIFNGHHILAARGRFTNPLLLKSKLYSIKTSLPGTKTPEEEAADVQRGLEHLNLENKIKSIMIDELYSSYTFEVQEIDRVEKQELAKKKKQKKRKTVCLIISAICLLIGFVVVVTLYLRVII